MPQSNTLQCHIYIAPHCPLEARPRFRPDCPLHPLDRHLLIYARDTCQPVLVGASNMQRDHHDFAWRVGMPVARTEANQFWQQDACAIAACYRGGRW
jgi:hypothetical protein